MPKETPSRLPNPVERFTELLVRNSGHKTQILETEKNGKVSPGRTLIHMRQNEVFPDVGLDQDYEALETGVYMLSLSMPGYDDSKRRWLRLGTSDDLPAIIESWISEIENEHDRHIAREGLRFNFLNLA